jgi:hypothetical protein
MPSHYWITSVLGQSRSLEHIQRMPMRHHTFEHSMYVNLCKENEKKGKFSIINSITPQALKNIFKNTKNSDFSFPRQMGFQSMATPQGEAIVSFYHLVMVLMTCVLGFTF